MPTEQGTKNTEISDSEKLSEVANIMRDAIKRFDSLDERMDALEKRTDSKRRDNEDEIVPPGKPKEPTVDSEEEEKAKADKARKDAEEKERCDAEEKERMDAKRRDEEEAAMADKARKDAEEERRHDSLVGEVADLKAKLNRLTPRARSDSDRERFASIQEQAEPAFQAFSDRAPAPMDGETPLDYKRRLATKMQKHSEKWGDKRLTSISDEAILDSIVGEIYSDSLAAARAGVAVAPGELREVVTRSLAGHTRIEFQGDAASWMNPLAGDALRGTGKFHVPA